MRAPALSLEASGNLGGICYTRWRGRHVARGSWTGTVPNTPAQQLIQGYISVVSVAWGQSLTAEERESWERLAKSMLFEDSLQEKRNPTGYSLFVKFNMKRKHFGLSVLKQAPVHKGWVELYLYGNRIVYNETTQNLQWRLYAHSPSEETYYQELQIAGPFESPGRKALVGEYRYADKGVIDTFEYKYVPFDELWYWTRMRAVRWYGYCEMWWYKQFRAA